MADAAQAIGFTAVGAAAALPPQPFAAPAVAANLAKWDLDRGAVAIKLRYDRAFNKYDPAGFLTQLMRSDALRERWEAIAAAKRERASRADAASAAGADPPSAPAADAEVAFTELSTAAVHMGFFDALEDAGAINAETSRLCRRMEDFVDGFAVGDKLREVLLCEDSELYELFGHEQRREFLFRLVSHLALGGPLNQYEDLWAPYAETAKACYKGMLRVRAARDGSGAPEVVSRVFSVPSAVGGEGAHRQSFCYVVVDEGNKTALVWAHMFKPAW